MIRKSIEQRTILEECSPINLPINLLIEERLSFNSSYLTKFQDLRAACVTDRSVFVLLGQLSARGDVSTGQPAHAPARGPAEIVRAWGRQRPCFFHGSC